MSASPQVRSSILELVGGTPVVRLARVAQPGAAALVAKLEHFNPTGSHKDRIAVRMLAHAEAAGRLRAGATIVAASCGSFAISLAWVCRIRGYHLLAVLPDTVTQEQQEVLQEYGASMALSPADLGMAGALSSAAEISAARGEISLNQYEDDQNWRAHFAGEGAELVAQAREYGAPPAAVVMTVGTGGTLRGLREALRAEFPGAILVGVTIGEGGAPRLSLRRSGPHASLGADRELEVSAAEAWRMKQRLAREEGLLVGITSGGNVAGAVRVAGELGPEKFVYTFCCDSGERYFSLEGTLG